MNIQYCFAHNSILYKLVFKQFLYYDTNLVDILKNEKLLNDYVLISEDSQSTIVFKISSEIIESEFLSDIEQVQENYSDVDVGKTHDIYNANKICSNDDSIQDIDDNSAQKIYNNLLSLYCSEISKDSKNTLKQRITKIVNSDNDFEIVECSKNTVSEIIEIINSVDLSKNQHYTLQKKKKVMSSI
ncbi:15182_t:CDS:1 [Cetraspora pellucida]|uniref:15182_t:CDS:1 n=1 Tax=Cetraspora pellucida TaxID=1433469 RepID=A0ACA9KS13_9GLOM|nr:15182_t:CDS:1 [Cetraspora pellucida]